MLRDYDVGLTMGLQLSQVTSREDVSEIIGLGMVDLIIPRGSNQLVRQVTNQAQGVPVLGHSEGICHVYVDTDADLEKALHIGTLLVHELRDLIWLLL